MSDKAPERDEITTLIDFLLGEGPNKDGQWFDEVAQTEQGAFWWRKYLRQIERLSADRALALVAAVYEDAGDAAADEYDSRDLPSGSDLAGYIRSRTPDDATAALERVKREAYERGVRKAASLLAPKNPRDDWTEYAYDCHLHAERILALIEEDTPDDQ